MNCLLLVSVLLVCLSLAEAGPTICTSPTGTCYDGSQLLSDQGTQYYSFQGIRYGQSPTGELRFKKPLKFEAGEEVFDVSGESKVVCTQWNGDYTAIFGQEDCLLLNVYVPVSVIEEGGNIPVMVWIHGGSFVSGSGTYSDYGPQYFMDNGVVMVTVNYRLGPFGFLSAATEELPGNLGLWDQSLALHWVRDNIQHFGGDAEQVTLFGESAGGESVSLQMFSRASRDLLNRVILQSDTFLSVSYHPMTASEAQRIAGKLSSQLGCSDLSQLWTCLNDKNTFLVMLAAISVTVQTETYGSTWMPVIDSTYMETPFLEDDPATMLSNGDFPSDIDVMIGATKDEGIIYLTGLLGGDSDTWTKYREAFNSSGVRQVFMIPFDSDVTAEDRLRTDQLVEFYLGSYDNITQDNAHAVIDLFSDSGSYYGNYKFINEVVSKGSRVFSYILTHQGEFSYTDMIGIPNFGVSHADDLLYLWNPVIQTYFDMNEADSLVRAQMTSSWSNFALTGDPTPPGSDYSWLPVSEQIQEETQQWFFNFSGDSSAMDSSSEIFTRLTFWDNIMDNSAMDEDPTYSDRTL